MDFDGDKLDFNSRSGYLSVSKDGDNLVMDFPSPPLESCDTPHEIVEAFGITPIECLKAEDYVVIFENAEQVQTASPNFEILSNLDCRGVLISAASDEYDFVARFFAPNLGIPEDPVTGSAYTLLAPYWAQKTNKSKFHAKQVSSRGGEVWCELKGDRVLISGRAVKYLEGSVEVET